MILEMDERIQLKLELSKRIKSLVNVRILEHISDDDFIKSEF